VGADKLDDLLTWCVELKIPAVTLWVLSTDNLARNPQEVSGILAAIETKLLELAKAPQIHRQRRSRPGDRLPRSVAGRDACRRARRRSRDKGL